MSFFLCVICVFFFWVICVFLFLFFVSSPKEWLPIPKLVGNLCLFFPRHLCLFFLRYLCLFLGFAFNLIN